MPVDNISLAVYLTKECISNQCAYMQNAFCITGKSTTLFMNKQPALNQTTNTRGYTVAARYKVLLAMIWDAIRQQTLLRRPLSCKKLRTKNADWRSERKPWTVLCF